MKVPRKFSMKVYDRLYNWVVDSGETAIVNGVETREIVNASLMLTNIRNRVVVHSQRKMNFPFAVAEWVSIMTGYAGLDLFTPYIRDYAKYSSDGESLDGAYGHRLHMSPIYMKSQIDMTLELLRKTPDTRRAVMAIYNGDDLHIPSRNTPCTLSLQFLYRNNRLHLITTMRSNDIVRGFTYDVFQFTMLQEWMARQLDLEPGFYYHNAGSLHAYASDYAKIPRYNHEPMWTPLMGKMPKIERDELNLLLTIMTSPHDARVTTLFSGLKTQYTADLGYSALAFFYRKLDPILANRYYRKVRDLTIRKVLRLWLRK